MNDHCRSENVQSVIVSLDAKKPFDSVDHGCVEKTLVKYGFGPKLIMYFKTLYKNASAKVSINGHLSKRIAIHRGFKQGDAFSNGCFNISIDPLIRNIIADRNISMLRMVTLRSREELQMKAGGYADDVYTVLIS